MNSKKHLFSEAERLFIYEHLTAEDISNRLNLNRKTVNNWKEEGDWAQKRRAFLKSKQSFHEELYEFARKLLQGIHKDMDAGQKIDPGRMFAFCRIVPMFTKVKNYEDDVTKKEVKAEPKGLTPELIARIEEEVLGITHNDRTYEDEEK